MDLHLRCETISCQQIPKTTRLYLDFLYQFDKVKRFYADVEPQPEALAEFAPAILERKYPRNLLADVLLEQNQRFGSGRETMAHIEQLREADTVAIVTGQQAGLFTGPMYTILKALTTVRVSRDLRAMGISAVPVFWIECEDHDQAEVNHCTLIGPQGQCQQVIYPIDPSEAGKPVSRIALTEAIDRTIDEAIALLPASEFMPDIEQQMRQAYRAGTGLADGFARLMAEWFQGVGLILLDPTDARLKRALAPLFEQVIRGTPEIAGLLKDQTNRLTDSGYHPQLHISEEMVPLFLIREDKRIGLTRQGNEFVLKTGDGAYSLDELLELVHSQPENLSPGVALRPLAQDTFLPTVGYVGGPSEIAYFGQLKPLFEWLGRPVTPILPRASATLVERRHTKLLNKYALGLRDLFNGFDQVMRRVVETSLASQTAGLFDAASQSFEAQLDQIRQALVKIDPTLGRATRTARDKILHQLNQLRTRFTEAQARKEELTVRQTQRALQALTPNGGLQERHLNALHFLSRYSLTLLPQLLETLDAWERDHQVIFMD